MSKKVDAVVIGAGPGGSIAGAYLAKAGLKTVILEKTDQIGGPRFGTYTKEGFTSELCCHVPVWFMTGNGGGGWWPKAAYETGAPLRWQCLPNTAVYLRGNLTMMPYCANGPAFVKFLENLSSDPIPENTKGELAKIFDLALAIPEDVINSEKMETMTCKEWMDSVTDDENAKYMMALLMGLYLLTEPQWALQNLSMNMFVGCAMASIAGRSNLTYPVGGAVNEIPKAFCEVVTNHGGEILLNHSVKKVIIEGGEAKGVVVVNPDGQEEVYEARHVIHSAFYTSIKKMLGDNLPQGIAKTIEGFDEVRNTAIDLHFALSRQVVDVWWCQVMLLTDELKYWGAILMPSEFEPSLNPEGKQLLQAEYFLPTEEFKKHPKEYWVKYLTDMVHSLYPEVKDVTEWTKWGVITPSVHYMFKPIPKVPLECPGINNLYFTGDYTAAPASGTDRAASSATLVAKNILKKEGKLPK